MSSSKANDNRKITIYDIAAEAGVSASTVSRVLTNNVKVNERKRQKILALVEKYNFRPDTFAKGLADARSRNIGILMPDVRNPYYASLFIACEWAARKENYSVSLHNFLSDVQLEEELLKGFHQQRRHSSGRPRGRASHGYGICGAGQSCGIFDAGDYHREAGWDGLRYGKDRPQENHGSAHGASSESGS